MKTNPLAQSDHLTRNLLTTSLGPLETQAMEILWTGGECNVRDVMKALDRDFAYTTVMTTLDRLFRKKFVSRCKHARAYLYSPRVTCQEWKDAAARDLVDKLMAGPKISREMLIECLMEVVSKEDASVLEDIARMARNKTLPLHRPDNTAHNARLKLQTSIHRQSKESRTVDPVAAQVNM